MSRQRISLIDQMLIEAAKQAQKELLKNLRLDKKEREAAEARERGIR